MGERIGENAKIDRTKYPGKFMYVDKEGYVCVANRGGGKKSSPEEVEKKAKSLATWKAAKKAVRDRISEQVKAYTKCVGRKDLTGAQEALDKRAEINGELAGLLTLGRREVYKKY